MSKMSQRRSNAHRASSGKCTCAACGKLVLALIIVGIGVYVFLHELSYGIHPHRRGNFAVAFPVRTVAHPHGIDAAFELTYVYSYGYNGSFKCSTFQGGSFYDEASAQKAAQDVNKANSKQEQQFLVHRGAAECALESKSRRWFAAFLICMSTLTIAAGVWAACVVCDQTGT